MPAHRIGEDLHELVEERLRRVDQRYTAGRRAIIDLLVSAGHPVSIAEIAENLPKLPRSSAYRTLVDLEAAGLVRRIAAHDDFSRFELSEDLTEHHHHLLCIDCGKVIDFAFTTNLERAITDAIDNLVEAQGFQPHSHRLDVLGKCSDCP